MIRMFKVPAVLDLYLVAMRRVEDMSDDFQCSWRSKKLSKEASSQAPPSCRNGTCDHYPALDLTESPPIQRRKTASSKSRTPQPPLSLSQKHILEQMYRPGATIDHFDHPLLFLTSGVPLSELKKGGREAAADNNVEPDNTRDDLDDLFLSPPQAPHGGSNVSINSALDFTLANSTTLGGLVELVRAVLSLTPRLTNLALSSFLERAVCGNVPPPALPALSSLSLGPAPMYWTASMRLDHSIFAQVKSLRLAGTLLLNEEARSLCKLPRLDHLEWIPGDTMWNREFIR